MVTHNQIVHKVHNQHTKDNGKLVTGNQCSANIGWSYFGNVHRTYGRCQSYSDTSQNTIQIECYQQIHIRFSVFEEKNFRIIRAECREEK